MRDALAARFESFSEALGAWIEGNIYQSNTGYSVYFQISADDGRVIGASP